MITSNRRRFLIGAGSLALSAPAFGQQLSLDEELQVRVENNSVPELCAEKDNIELDFISARLRRMQFRPCILPISI